MRQSNRRTHHSTLRRRWWGMGIALISLLIVACQSTEPVGISSNPWIDRLPRDASLVMANERPMDDGQLKRWLYTLQALSAWTEVFSSPLVKDMTRLLASMDQVEDWHTMGINPNGHWAMYVQSNALVAHLSLESEDTFWAELERRGQPRPNAIKGKNGKPIQTLTTDWPVNFGSGPISIPPVLTLSTQGNGLKLTLRWSDELTSTIRPSMDGSSQYWSPDAWSELNQTHGLDGHLTVLVQPDAGGLPMLSANPVCLANWTALNQSFPTLIFGTQELSASRIDLLGRAIGAWAAVEPLNESGSAIDVSNALSAQVAGLGLVLDLAQLRTQLLATETLEPECLQGYWIAASKRALQALANRPIPPILTSLTGLVSRFEGQQDDGIHYFSELYLTNPTFLLGLAQLFSPDLASLDLRDGQRPQRLPLELTEPISNLPVFLSSTQRSIRLTSSDDLTRWATDSSEPHMSTARPPPLAVATVSFARLDELEQVGLSSAVAPYLQSAVATLQPIAEQTHINQMRLILQQSQLGLDLSLAIQDQSN